jgi:hypothetical protein
MFVGLHPQDIPIISSNGKLVNPVLSHPQYIEFF